MKNFNYRLLLTLFCFLLISPSFAGYVGEQRGGDLGTGGETGGDGGTSVNDGGRNNGKDGSNTKLDHNTGNGDGSREPNKKESAKPPPETPIVKFHYDGPVNPNLLGTHIFEVARVQDGKVVEKVQLKTEGQLKETVTKEIDNHVDDSFNNNARYESEERRTKPLNNGLEKETEDLRKLLANANIQAKEEEQKKELQALEQATIAFQDLQMEYARVVETMAADLSSLEEKTEKAADERRKSIQAAPSNIESAPSNEAGAIQILKNISMSILNFIVGDSGENETGIAFKRFFESLIKKGPKRSVPYVNSALQSSGALPIKELNPVGPAREKLMQISRAFLAPNVKIQYSKDLNKRGGPRSFDCSGFVSYVYNKVGLELSKTNGGIPNVANIIDKDGMFHEIDKSEARVGDLIVHLKVENVNNDNHVGIYGGIDPSGNVLEISATVRNGRAKLDPDHRNFKSSIAEHPPYYMGQVWHIYRWNK
jgi:cell wall-associated NlpC family hydrolase